MAIRGIVTGLFSPRDLITDGLLSAPLVEPAILSGASFLHSLVEIDFRSGTFYGSWVGTATPTRQYEGRVISISPINRSIPAEGGLYSVGNVEVALSNHDGYFSQLKASEGFLNLPARILMGYPDLGFSTFEPAITGVVTEPIFDDDGQIVRITITDDVLGRLDRPITDVLQRTIPGGYPIGSTPEDVKPELIPYVMGIHQKPVDSTRDVGQLPARRIAAGLSTWSYVAGHGDLAVDEVYVYGVLAVSGYSTEVIEATGGEKFTLIHFDADPQDLDSHRPDEIEVTWNGTGITDIDGPIDADSRPLYQLKHFLVERCGYEESEFDVTNLATHANAMAVRGIKGAWAIVDARLSIADVVAEAMNSWGCRFYRKRSGLIAFSFIGTEATEVEDYRETHEIVGGSFRIPMNPKENTASRLQVNWDWNYVREFFARQPDLNSPSEEENLVYPKRRNKSLKYLRTLDGDPAAPLAVGALYLGLMRENVQFPEFAVPGRFFPIQDLGDAVTVTHSKGIGANGYEAQRVVVLSTHINPMLTVSRLHLRGIVAEEPEPDTADLSATFVLEGGVEVILETA